MIVPSTMTSPMLVMRPPKPSVMVLTMSPAGMRAANPTP